MSNASSNMSLVPEKSPCLYHLSMAWKESYLTEDTFILLVVSTVISLIAVLPTILLNCLVIFAVATRHHLQNNCNLLLTGLASADLFTGLVAQPIRIAVEIRRILGVGPFCTIEKVYGTCINLSTIASLTHLVLISGDRYIAIKHSLRYDGLVTKQRILIGELLGWAFIILAIIPELVLAIIKDETKFSVQVVHAVTTIICTICFYLVIGINVYLFSATRRQKKRIRTQQVPQAEAKKIKKDNKAVNTVVIILGALITTYLPGFLNATFLILRSAGDSGQLTAVNIVVSWFTLIFILLGSLVNPIIYCWRSRKLRRVFVAILLFRQS